MNRMAGFVLSGRPEVTQILQMPEIPDVYYSQEECERGTDVALQREKGRERLRCYNDIHNKDFFVEHFSCSSECSVWHTA